MARHIEPLSGGLVTVRDPVVLAAGELQQMQNLVYRPGSQAPQFAAGRAAFGTVAATATPVRGLRTILFDNADYYLVAMQGSALYSAAVGDTGSFGQFATYETTAATALDAVHFDNEWFLFSGIGDVSNSVSSTGRNHALYVTSTGTGAAAQVRRHGMLYTNVQVSATAGAGTWTAGTTGYFEYWHTELFTYTKDGVPKTLESAFLGTPYTLFISATNMQASITIPDSPVNSGSQKWRLYRAGPKPLATDSLYPEGFKLFDGDFLSTGTGTNLVVDGSATTGAAFSANATAVSGYANWTNATAVFVSDNNRATHTGVTPGAVAVTFATQSFTEPVVGIEVLIEGSRSSSSIAVNGNVQVSNDAGVTWSPGKLYTPSTTEGVITLGSSSDLWGLNWSKASFVSGQFRVRIIGFAPSATLSVDLIQARLTTAGSTAQTDESTPYPSVVIEAVGVDAAVGSHGPPPIATTGTVFQGCLVTNSVVASERAHAKYSLANQPDYFPAPYFLDFETGENDIVTNLKTLNNRLGVFLNTGVWRVNYLPSEADANFNRGICREEVSAQYGCVNAMCAVVYSGPTGRSEIAFVSDTGIYSTDLYAVRELTDDLDWRAMVSTSATPIALINDPEHNELLFYFKNTTLTDSYNCLHLSYDRDHIRNGRLKLSGPVHLGNGNSGQLFSAWAARRTNGDTSIYLGYGGDTASATANGAGAVYREQGFSNPAANPLMSLRTRRLFLGGIGDEVRLDNTFTYVVAGSSGSHGLALTPTTLFTNDATATYTAQSYSWSGQPMFRSDFSATVEGVDFTLAHTASASAGIGFQMLVLDYTHQGGEDSGKQTT